MNEARTRDNHQETERRRARLIVPGMGSDHCAGLVATSLGRLEGVATIRTNIATHRVDVEFDPGQIDLDGLKSAVERAGYDVVQAESEPRLRAHVVRLTVPGMGSDHCAGLVSGSIRRLPGIADVGTNIGNHRVTVRFDPAHTDAAAIEAAVERAGYDVEAAEAGPSPARAPAADDVEERYLATAWKRLWIAAVPTTLIMSIMGPHMFWQPIPGYSSRGRPVDARSTMTARPPTPSTQPGARAMKPNETLSILFACLLIIGAATTATAQTESQDHDAHHPAEAQAAPPVATEADPSPAGTQGVMPGMGMMTPEMMQMMQRMMGQGGMPGMMGGMQGRGMPDGGMGQGMMGRTPMMGGMMMCPMMPTMGARSGMDMHSMMGAGMVYGMPHGSVEEMTPERVRAFLRQRLEQHGNPRLKLGEIATAADGSITAEIVTVDGSLVQKLAFNRYPGLFRQIAE